MVGNRDVLDSNLLGAGDVFGDPPETVEQRVLGVQVKMRELGRHGRVLQYGFREIPGVHPAP
jgi:hypothetical protein